MSKLCDFLKLIIDNQMEACNQFEANQSEILSLFTAPKYVIVLFSTNSLISIDMLIKGHKVFEPLFTTPRQFYDLYEVNNRAAKLFMSYSKIHFSSVFQKIEDIVELALLESSCVLSLLDEDLIQCDSICNALFQLAAIKSTEKISPNICLNILSRIPAQNISQQDFDKLYRLMADNPDIDKDDLKWWKENYNQNTLLPSSYGFFSGTVRGSLSGCLSAMSQYMFGNKG